ncbi:hypothetical protein HZB94_03535 [Candidatus Falkowbacteria bacterium]|nr:hypothetical protein [Candidatus Falkowbacteria bacterium]
MKACVVLFFTFSFVSCEWEEGEITTTYSYPDTAVAEEQSCGEIDFVGKCQGTVLKYCADSVLDEVDCGEINATCGWDEKYQYNTCLSLEVAYPQGEIPDTCPNIGAGECVKDSQNEIRECVVNAGVAVWQIRKCDDDNGCTADSCEKNICLFEYNCPEGSYCDNGKCKAECVPNCEDKECGSDGCGGECGSCSGKFECDFANNLCRRKCENGLWCDADQKCCRNACIPSTSTCCDIEDTNAAVWCNEKLPNCVEASEKCHAPYNMMCCPTYYYFVCFNGNECDCC